MINAGEVTGERKYCVSPIITGTELNTLSNGVKNTANKKSTPVTTAVRPVRPPAATPEVDSTNDVTVEVPAIEPITVPIESANKARSTFSRFPVSSTKGRSEVYS